MILPSLAYPLSSSGNYPVLQEEHANLDRPISPELPLPPSNASSLNLTPKGSNSCAALRGWQPAKKVSLGDEPKIDGNKIVRIELGNGSKAYVEATPLLNGAEPSARFFSVAGSPEPKIHGGSGEVLRPIGTGLKGGLDGSRSAQASTYFNDANNRANLRGQYLIPAPAGHPHPEYYELRAPTQGEILEAYFEFFADIVFARSGVTVTFDDLFAKSKALGIIPA